jgi:type IV pilus assembly protein PilP
MRITLAILVLALAACSSAPAPSPIGSAPPAVATAPALAAEEADRLAPPRAPIDEGALVEGDKSRDPFRAYAVAPTPPPEDTRPRKSRRFGVDQLSLVGVVTRTAEPRAMLVDPRGKGWIVAPGDLVGRPEVVGARTVSWRVDRIREREVVLVRDDAYELAAADTTRVLAMRQDPKLTEDD